MEKKKITKEQKLKKIIKEQQKVIEILSNKEVFKEISHALKGFEKKHNFD